jgi:acyl carrier protein
MSDDSKVLAGQCLDEAVRNTIANVLMVETDAVSEGAALVDDLGAESIDFLDLVFRLEEHVGRKIPPERWEQYARSQLAGRDPGKHLTVAMVMAFAHLEAARPAGFGSRGLAKLDDR